MASRAITITDWATQIPGKLIDSKTWRFPIIETTNSHGKQLTWTIIVRVADRDESIKPADVGNNQDDFQDIESGWLLNEPMDDFYMAWYKVESGQVYNGVTKVKESVPTVVLTGKNIGRKNATNVLCQALRDCLGMYNKQKQKSTTGVEGDHLLPPMLAQNAADQKNLIVSEADPAWVQPKFNGVRVLTYLGDKPIMYSRKRLEYPGFPGIKDEISRMVLPPEISHLDGEIYAHGVALQVISGCARRAEAKKDDPKMFYHIYDCITKENLPYHDRMLLVEKVFELNPSVEFCKPVPTHKVKSLSEVQPHYKKWLNEGLEGAMLRLNATYEFSYNDRHSKVLLKYKPTFDAEYTIVDYFAATEGKAKGCLMVVCLTKEGQKFNVTPALTIDERVAMYQQFITTFGTQWKNQPLIVYYDELSIDGIPQRARTKMELRTWD